MLRLLLQRLLFIIPTVFVVVTGTFFLIYAAPGGPFDEERMAPPAAMEQIARYYNLDQPVTTQYALYLKRALSGDLGPSYRHPGRSVNDILAEGFPVTAELALYALLLASFLGLLSGTIAALGRNSWRDYIPMSVAMVGICMPSFLLGPLLILIFGVWLDLLPVSGWGDYSGDKILPVMTLGLGYAAYVARLSRGGFISVLEQDYVRTARAKGLSEVRVVMGHAMRGALIPVVAFSGPAIAGLLAGSFVVETIFHIPGIGRFYVQAAFNRDYTMILGTTVVLAILTLSFNLIADLVIAWMDPRSRKQD